MALTDASQGPSALDRCKEDGNTFYPQAAGLLHQHPEWVSDQAWEAVVKQVSSTYARDGSWATVSRAWFSPRVPTGTVYGFDWRTNAGIILPPATLPELQKFYGVAPLKYSVCTRYADALGPNGQATAEQYQRVVGPLLAYYVPAMRGAAALMQNDPAQYGALMNRAAALNPNYYLALGKYDVEHQLESQAAAAYQAAIDHQADAVSVSNQSAWLVNYYYDHGQPERALVIARQAAEVYSERGLETLAGLLERMGRNQEAGTYYEKIKERYNDPKPLQFFHLRSAGTQPVDPAEMKAMAAKIFPQGIPEVTLAQLPDRPPSGVLVHGENALTRKCGLKPGAIVVALDGKRVANMAQYTYVRALNVSPEMDFLVYQDDHYQAIHTSAPGRMLRLEFTTWPEQK